MSAVAATSGDAGGSYANVLNKEKQPQQEAAPTVAPMTVEKDNEPPAKPVEPQDVDAADEAEDDSNFVPVIGHKKSHNRGRKVRDQRSDNRGARKATAAAARGEQPRRSTDRKKREDKDNKGGKTEEKKSDESGSGNEAKPDAEPAAPKVFVEAPLPKVNPWKVSRCPSLSFFPLFSLPCLASNH